MTTLREALAAATDSAGRIHSTRALTLAIDEADARHALACAWGLVALRQRDEYRDNPAVTVIADRATADERDHARTQLQLLSLRHDRMVDAAAKMGEALQESERARDEERERANEWLAQAHAARLELADLDLVLPAACGSRVDAAQTLVSERDSYQQAAHTAGEALGRMMGERDAARAEVERLRAALAKVRPDVCREESIDALDSAVSASVEADRVTNAAGDADALVREVSGHGADDALWRPGETAAECWARHRREAEERGARWVLEAIGVWLPPDDVATRAARICREARERGERE
jgi:hypothetical protein